MEASINKIYVVTKGTLLAVITSISFAVVQSWLFFGNTGNAETINAGIEINALRILFPLLLSPIVEELIFRKWIPGVFQDVIGRKKSILFSNAIFTVLHADLFFIPYFANGLIYAFYYEKTKDIKVPILMHVFYNLFVFLTTFI